MKLWKKLDLSLTPLIHLREGDEVYYAREYISRGGYQASQANDLILNFKKPTSCRGTSQWAHKVRAIEQFANELAALISGQAVIAAIPTSKSRTAPDYDSRLEDVLAKLQQEKPTIQIVTPVERVNSRTPAHAGGNRSPSAIATTLAWRGLPANIDHVVLIDDVLTTGGHFRACKDLIVQNTGGRVKVYGVFWTRAIDVSV